MKKIVLLLLFIPLLTTISFASGGDADVKVIYAEGKIFYHEIYVTWSTEYEHVPCDFVIEASENRKDWRIRGRVKSKGASKRHSEYKFVDPRENQFRYYRIRRADSRGPASILSQFELANYSITVTMEEMTIDNELKLVLEYVVEQDQELMVRIYNRIGEQVVTKVMPFKTAGQYVYHMDISTLKPDNYLLQVNQVLLDKAVGEKAFKVAK